MTEQSHFRFLIPPQQCIGYEYFEDRASVRCLSYRWAPDCLELCTISSQPGPVSSLWIKSSYDKWDTVLDSTVSSNLPYVELSSISHRSLARYECLKPTLTDFRHLSIDGSIYDYKLTGTPISDVPCGFYYGKAWQFFHQDTCILEIAEMDDVHFIYDKQRGVPILPTVFANIIHPIPVDVLPVMLAIPYLHNYLR